MKALLTCLLLVYPLITSAYVTDTTIGMQRLSEKLEPPTFRRPYMIWASHRHHIQLVHYYQHNDMIIAEFNVDGKVYLGWNPGCGNAKGYCPNMWIDTIEQLMSSLLADYPDAGYVFKEDFIDVFYGR